MTAPAGADGDRWRVVPTVIQGEWMRLVRGRRPRGRDRDLVYTSYQRGVVGYAVDQPTQQVLL